MNNKVIEKSILSNWILPEAILNYKPTSNYTILKGYRVLKILKFLKLKAISNDNNKSPNDFEIHCILSDSNYSIIAKISRKTINYFERLNKARITEDTVNTIILVKDLKLVWISRQRLLVEFASTLGTDFIQQLELFSNNKHSKKLNSSFNSDISDDLTLWNEDNLKSFAILNLDNDDFESIKIYDYDQDKINRAIKPIYFTTEYISKIKPIKVEIEQEFEI